MKKIMVACLIAGLVIGLGTGSVLAYTINDTTLVGRGWTNDNIHRGMIDAIGPGYNVYGIDIRWMGDVLFFDIYTDFNGYENAGGVPIVLADLALDLDLDGLYEYGIDLTTDSSRNVVQVSKVYSGVTWLTSKDFLEGKTSGIWEYGEYWGTNNLAPAPIVEIKTGNYVGDASLSKTALSGHEADFLYTVQVHSSIFGDDLDSEFRLFFANANCANDIIGGTSLVPETPDSPEVPAPAPFLLLGCGLLGLAGLRRKFAD